MLVKDLHWDYIELKTGFKRHCMLLAIYSEKTHNLSLVGVANWLFLVVENVLAFMGCFAKMIYILKFVPGTLTQVVFGEFCKISKNTFFTELLLDSASGLILDVTHTHHCWGCLMFSGHVFWSETCSFHAENVGGKCWNRRFRAFNFLCSQLWWGQWYKRQ